MLVIVIICQLYKMYFQFHCICESEKYRDNVGLIRIVCIRKQKPPLLIVNFSTFRETVVNAIYNIV